MCTVYFGRFKARNAFIGYQNDTPATVVFQASNQLQHLKMKRGERKWEGFEQASVLGNIPLDELEEIEGSTLWKQAVSHQKCYCGNENSSEVLYGVV